MRYLKILGLAAIAATALMAFANAGTASATVLCSTTTSPCPAGQKSPAGTRFEFSLASGVSLTWTNGSEVLETCNGSTIRTEITNGGSGTTTVTSENQALTFSGCTFPSGTTKLGGLEIHTIAGTSNGTVTATGEIGWTFNSIFFGTCFYGWKNGGEVGEITEGKPAVLHLNSQIVKLSGSSIACPENGELRGTYTLTEPSSTTLSVGAS
jgi:hypothetical protein